MLACKAKELDTFNTMVTMGKVSAAKIGLVCFVPVSYTHLTLPTILLV